MDIAEALRRLLAGTGWLARKVGDTAWRIEHAPAAPPHPEPDAPAEEPPPEPILVTATKQPLDLLSLPAAVSVAALTRSERGDPASGSATVSSQLEGLALTSLGPGRNRMFLRGVADSAFTGESQSTVAVVLDEARLTYAAPDPDIRLVDIERVEVLKGPQGSLYGTGALGGIYRMVSRPVDLDEASLAVSGGGAVVTHGHTGYSASTVANLPLVTGTAALRLVGYAAEEPGWVNTGTRDDANSTRVSGIRALFGLAPVAGWRLDLTGFAQWLRSRDSRYVYAPRSYQREAQMPEPHDNDLAHIGGRLTGELGGIDVMLASAMTWHKVDDTLDATIGAEDFGLADPQLLLDSRDFRTSDSELRLRGRWGGIGWLAGLSHLDARQSLAARLQGRSGSLAVVDDDRRDSHDTAAYFNLTVPLTRTLSLDGGARLFSASIRETRVLSAGPVSRKQDKSGVTPTLALAWQPTPRRLVYLRYGSAFRQGGTDITPEGKAEPLRGDELASIEAGWRESLANGGRAELGAWYSRWENVQSDVLEDNGLIETANAGTALILGIEGSLTLPLARSWEVETGANFTDARLTHNTLGYELHDRRLPVVPEYTLRAALRRDFTLGSFDGWAKVNLRYLGPARMSFDPDLDRKMGRVTESEFEMHLARGQLEFAISVRNLLGDKSNVFAFGNPLRYRSAAQYTPQEPTTLVLSMSVEM